MLQCDATTMIDTTCKNTTPPMNIIHGGRSNSVDNPPKSDPMVSLPLEEGNLARSHSAPTLAKMKEQSTFVCIHSPNKATTWRWGQSAFLMWERRDLAVSEVRIILRQKSSSTYTIVADHVENNGLFVFKIVPSTLHPASDYFVRIISMDGTMLANSECFSIGN